MQHEQASRTALVIAASLVLLHHSRKHSGLVSKDSADFCAQMLENHSAKSRIFLRIVRQNWFRPIANLIEHVTIPGILLHYALRKNCITGLVRSALTNGTPQIVVLGAGFDPLSFKLQREFPITHFWEIDHPATQRYKLRAFSKIGTERLHLVAVDLAVNPLDGEALIKSGFDPAEPTCWIAEGLLMYFPGNVIPSLMRTLASLSAPGSQLVFTFMEKQSDGRIRFDRQSKLLDWWLQTRCEPFLWATTRNELADCIRPWRVVRVFDGDDLRKIGSGLTNEVIARGEIICLAEI